MKKTTKLLTAITVVGIGLSFLCLVSGKGGGGLEEGYIVLAWTSLLVFVCAITILILNFRKYKHHLDTFLFMLSGFPLTVVAADAAIKNRNYSKTPDLHVKYQRPVHDTLFKKDSANIQLSIDSLIAHWNSRYGRATIKNGVIDTIIYSQSGDKVFVSYIKIFDSSEVKRNFSPAFLYGETRDPDHWILKQAKYNLGGSYEDAGILKEEVRRFYFNQFSFMDKDSSKKNFFWRKIMNPNG